MIHLLALAGVLTISFSAIFVRLASVSPVTATFFRAAYAVPVLFVIAHLRARGDDASYQEYMRFGRSLVAGAVAGSFGVGSKISTGLLELPPLRKLAQRMIPKPGEGPSAANMARGFFKIELVGQSAQGRKLRTLIGDSLDAGNGGTVKMMCESALAMTENENQLPRAAGVITPSVALGDVLEKRLLAAGMRIEVSE